MQIQFVKITFSLNFTFLKRKSDESICSRCEDRVKHKIQCIKGNLSRKI